MGHRRNLVVFAFLGLSLPACILNWDRSGDGGFRSLPALKETLASVGMVPVLPPSEDVRVGDIFVYPRDPDASIGVQPMVTRWATLPVQGALDQEYRARPSFPRTPDAFLQISPEPNGRTWSEASSEGEESIFSSTEDPRRLRNVSLNLSSILLTEGDLNRLIPSEVINLTLGTAFRDAKAVTLRLQGGESYAISLQSAISSLLEIVTEEEASRYRLKDPYRQHLKLIAAPGSTSVWVRVVTEVLYIRGVEVTIQAQAKFDEDDAIMASELQGLEDPEPEAADSESEGSDESQDPDTEPTSPPEESDDSPEAEDEAAQPVAAAQARASEPLKDHQLDEEYTSFARADAINELLIEADVDDVPGGMIRFLSVTRDSVSLRRIWQRGVAFGLRGLSLKIDVETGIVEQSSYLANRPPPPEPR